MSQKIIIAASLLTGCNAHSMPPGSSSTGLTRRIVIGSAFAAVLSPSRAAAIESLDVIEILKIYGRLAGSECYGKKVQAQQAASCELTGNTLRAALQSSGPWDEAEFMRWLNAQPFRWPLKPWGTANSASNAKTATMNKSAETAVFMIELEKRGLYDPRNPAGPLPTSLRPQLNAKVGEEPIDARAGRVAFRALAGAELGSAASLTATRLDSSLRDATNGEGAAALDWYTFQALIDRDDVRVVWPY